MRFRAFARLAWTTVSVVKPAYPVYNTEADEGCCRPPSIPPENPPLRQRSRAWSCVVSADGRGKPLHDDRRDVEFVHLDESDEAARPKRFGHWRLLQRERAHVFASRCQDIDPPLGSLALPVPVIRPSEDEVELLQGLPQRSTQIAPSQVVRRSRTRGTPGMKLALSTMSRMTGGLFEIWRNAVVVSPWPGDRVLGRRLGRGDGSIACDGRDQAITVITRQTDDSMVIITALTASCLYPYGICEWMRSGEPHCPRTDRLLTAKPTMERATRGRSRRPHG